MTTETLPATTQSSPEKRQIALIKALGLDRVAPEERELALAISDRYELDPMLRHLVLIEGRPVVTRDGLLHVAHRSPQFDGLEVTIPALIDGYWRCTATVWRKDMSHPFVYPGRFPAGGRKGKPHEYAEEMAIKVAESMALRRAFDVAAPVEEERWADRAPETVEDIEHATIADRARALAAAIPTPAQEPSGEVIEAEVVPEPADERSEAPGACGEPSPYDETLCDRPAGHKGAHGSGQNETW